jgi:UDP-2-acetamido-3-amino-2,3-dideoxy-glucuronate N-acetyltransferase
VFTNVTNPRSHVARKNEYKRTLVKQGASIGANATVVCGVTLGRYCFIGAGAVVTRDVPDYAMVHGNPARLRGWMCYCGVMLDVGTSTGGAEIAQCCGCSRRYQKRGLVVVEYV